METVVDYHYRGCFPSHKKKQRGRKDEGDCGFHFYDSRFPGKSFFPVPNLIYVFLLDRSVDQDSESELSM